MKKINLLLSTALISTLYAAGYKIPEQSIKSVALSAAYVAGADEADATYFNPANMSFIDDGSKSELAFTYIHLPKVKFNGRVYTSPNSFVSSSSKSKREDFLLPHFHYISPKISNFRFGLSLVTPAGLSKRWESEPQIYSAKKFLLRVVEINPTISYLVNDKLSVGAGVRFIYSEGEVKIERDGLYKQDMEGDTDIKIGYNLAISYKPYNPITLAITYRSKVDLKEKGDAKGYISRYLITKNLADYSTKINFNSSANVTVPLPAAINLAFALQLNKSIKAEAVFERTFWKSYKELDFNFNDPLIEATLGKPKDKNWKDSNSFRFGLTHKSSSELTTMAAIVYDQTPVPSKTLGFELPDSDAMLFSLGTLYNIKENLKIGVAYLYSHKLKRRIDDATQNINKIFGTFSGSGAHLVNLSLNYRF